MKETEYVIMYDDMDKHYIVFEKNNDYKTIEPIMRFVCSRQAYDYFKRRGFDLIHPRDADWPFPDDVE